MTLEKDYDNVVHSQKRYCSSKRDPPLTSFKVCLKEDITVSKAEMAQVKRYTQ